jgi:hypothetical protein
MAAAKKKAPPTTQAGLFPSIYARTLAAAQAEAAAAPAPALLRHDELWPEERRPPTIAELPRTIANEVEPPCPPARVVERKADGVTVVPHLNGQWLVSRVRDDGTSFCGAFYSRAELEQLVAAATEALR